MRFAVEILNHIFGFLVSERHTLFVCSKHPTLSPFVERHVYYHAIINTRGKRSRARYTFTPDYLSRLISKNPHILYYVRILEIQAQCGLQDPLSRNRVSDLLNKFGKTLVLFPELECIMLTPMQLTPNQWWWWYNSTAFQAALEDRLNLPTLKEVHLVGSDNFPLSLLHNCKNVKHLSLTGSFVVKGEFHHSTLPQLKSMSLCSVVTSFSLRTWLKPHLNKLEALECVLSSQQDLSTLIILFSETLNKQEIDFINSQYYDHDLMDYHVSLNLQRLVVRTTVTAYHSRLWAAVQAINFFTSAARHLVIDIAVNLFHCDFAQINFFPLAVLGDLSLSIPRIDLYIHTLSPVTHSQVLSSLENYEGIQRLISEGVMVIHPQKIAPPL